MDKLSLASKTRKHWMKWLPQKVAALREAGEFEEAVQGAALAAHRQILELMQQGYQAHEAEEVALRQFVLLEPEADANLEPWEKAELDAMEAEHQKANKG